MHHRRAAVASHDEGVPLLLGRFVELGAAELFSLTGERRYLRDALEYAAKEPVTPWMGADTARHYEWYPWINHGHDAVWRVGDAAAKRQMVNYYRQGLERVAARAKNGFRVGIPFIWCSNILMSAFATQALLYRRMTGDERFREYEAAARLGLDPRLLFEHALAGALCDEETRARLAVTCSEYDWEKHSIALEPR